YLVSTLRPRPAVLFFSVLRRPPFSTLFPYTTLFRSVLFVLPALAWPRILGPIERAWMKLAEAIGSVMTVVILTLAFIVVFTPMRSEEHTSELQSRGHLVCRLLLEKKKKSTDTYYSQQ